MKNQVLRFLPFYLLISAFQASSRTPKGRTFRALSIDIENSSFHAFGLGIENRPWKSMDILRKIQPVFKMAENAEKQGFAFFAFLPPYFGVSGSLVSRNR